MEQTESFSMNTGRGSSRWRAGMEGVAVAGLIGGLLSLFRRYNFADWMGDYRGEVALIIGFLLATVLLWYRRDSWINLGLSWPERPKRLPGQVGLVLMLGYAAAILIPLVIVPLFGLEAPSLERHSQVTGNLGYYLIRVTLISWGTAAFLEEMVARAFLINRFSNAFGGTRNAVIAAVILQGVLFGLAHPSQGLAGMLQTGSIGLVFGYLYIRYQRNLWPLIFAHGLMDTLGFTAIYFGAVP